ncbi:choice-of-anchor Q domain-containing protein [Botrimarina sp.]|uniref:choice-of-anchor Q domain-containing protein n=1 Tax=Botrimarina sp. TaxID=2795802 RepID=UPI0032EB03E2
MLATFTVNTRFDIVDPDDQLVSLREAIAMADDEVAHPGPDRIEFDPSLRFSIAYGNYVGFDEDGFGVLPRNAEGVPFTPGQFEINSAVTIDATAAGVLRIGQERGFANFTHRVLQVNEGADVEMINVIIQGGDSNGLDGGGVYNAGRLRLTNSVVGSNYAIGASGGRLKGGGIYNAPTGDLTLDNTHIGEIALESDFFAGLGFDGDFLAESEQRERDGLVFPFVVRLPDELRDNNTDDLTRIGGNIAFGFGGGVYNDGALLVTGGSVIEANRFSWNGGGIYNAGVASIVDSEVRRHDAVDTFFDGPVGNQQGAGVYNAEGAVLTISGSRFVGNSGHQGGAIANFGELAIVGTLFYDNDVQTVPFAFTGEIGRGGAVYDAGTRTAIDRSFFGDNRAEATGGAIYNLSNPDLTVRQSTFLSNTSPQGAVVVATGAAAAIRRSTFSQNGVETGGSVTVASGGALAIGGTILAGSVSTPSGLSAPSDLLVEAGGAVLSLGNNLIERAEGHPLTSGGATGTDLVGVDARLADAPPVSELVRPGLPLPVVGLLPDSPSIDSFTPIAASRAPADDLDFTRGVVPSGQFLTVALLGGALTPDGYAFGANQGVTLTVPPLSPRNYTFEIDFSWDALTPFYKKVLDFKALTTDFGLYTQADALRFYTDSPSAGRFVAGQTHRVTLTRDGNTDVVSGYLDGKKLWEFTDTESRAALFGGFDPLHLFQDDNATSQSEAGSGVLKRFRYYTAPLTEEEVAVAFAADETAPATDQRGEPRVVGPAGDRGAYESLPLGSMRVDTLSGLADGIYGQGEVSLADAVHWANAVPGADTIAFDADAFASFAEATPQGSPAIPAALPPITDDLTIHGPGADRLEINGAGIERILEVAPGVSVTVVGLTLAGGRAPADGPGGGAVLSRGDLTLREVVIRDSRSDDGGAIDGGAIYNTGRLTVIDSTLHDNLAAGRGGAVYSDSPDGSRFVNTTISGNSADRGGALYNAAGDVDLVHSTWVFNTAADTGGGIDAPGGLVRLNNSIVGSNAAGSGPADLAAASFTTTGANLFGVDPLVGVLADLGGPTPTHGLLPGSPAIDAGVAGAAMRDQRGVLRPVGAAVDIGAFEYEPPVLSNPIVVDTTSAVVDGYFAPGEMSLAEAVLFTNDDPSLDRIAFASRLYNLAEAPGAAAAATSSTLGSSPSGATDGSAGTAWTAAAGDTLSAGGEPSWELSLAAASTLQRVVLTGVSFPRGRIEFRDEEGMLIAEREFAASAGRAELTLRGLGGVASLRVVVTEDGPAAPSIAEVEVVGPAAEIALTGAALRITDDVTIVGPGADRVRVAAGFQSGVFEVNTSGFSTISGLTIAEGDRGGSGGGVYNQGFLRLIDVFLDNNRGGLFNAASANAFVEGSTIANNFATRGAGIENYGALEVLNSTLSNNTANFENGGGLFNSGTADVFYSTIAQNFALSGGGVFNSTAGQMSLGNSLIAGNTDANASGDAVNDGIVFSFGYNLVGDATSFTLFANPNDQLGTAADPIDPMLTDLVVVASTMPLHGLLPGSPAMDAGGSSSPGVDQRGVPRPQVGGADIGAFEAEPVDTSGDFVVDNLSDELNADYSEGDLTLREAILLANVAEAVESATIQQIRFDAGVMGEALAAGGARIVLTRGALLVNDKVAIDPLALLPEADRRQKDALVIDSGGQSRVLEVRNAPDRPNAAALVYNTTLTGGSADGDGGGVYNEGDLLLGDSAVVANTASDEGGGVYNVGQAQLTRALIDSNSAGEGGGLHNGPDASLRIDRSTVSGNLAIAEGFGGGVWNSGSIEARRSAIVNNTAGGNGGGLFNFGAFDGELLTISGNGKARGGVETRIGGGVVTSSFDGVRFASTTITDNHASFFVGGIAVEAEAEFVGSLIAGNTDASGRAPDADRPAGTVTASYTLIGDNSGAGPGFLSPGNGNLINADPLLGPLADNGGDTLTHLLQPLSPAIDAGDPMAMRLTDQRGRPLVDQAGVGAAIADIGAYEVQGILTSNWRYEALDKSQFGPGDALVYGFGFDEGVASSSVSPDPYFLGFEFDTGPLKYGGIEDGPFGSKFGGQLNADFAGKFGFDVGFYVNSGSVDVTYDGAVNYVVDADPSGATASVSAFVDVRDGGLYTVSPKVGAYADLVLQLDVSASATGCLVGCVTAPLLDIRFDHTEEMFALNRQLSDADGRPVFLDSQGEGVARDRRTGQFYDLDGQPIDDPGPVVPLFDGDIRYFSIPIEEIAQGVVKAAQTVREKLEDRKATRDVEDANRDFTRATNDLDRNNQRLEDAEARMTNPASGADFLAARDEVTELAGKDYADAVTTGAERPAKGGKIAEAEDATIAAKRRRDAAEENVSKRDADKKQKLKPPSSFVTVSVGEAEGSLLGAQVDLGIGASAGFLSADRNVGSLQVTLPDVNLRDTSVASGGKLSATTDAFPASSELDAKRQIAKAQVDLASLLPVFPGGKYNLSAGPLSLDITTVSYNLGPQLNVTQDVAAEPIVVDQGIEYRFYDPTLYDPLDPALGTLALTVDVNGVAYEGGAAVQSVVFGQGDQVTIGGVDLTGDGANDPILVMPSMTLDARFSNDIGLDIDLDGVFEAFALSLSAFGVSIVDIGPLIRHAHTLASFDAGSVFDRTFDLGQATVPLRPFTLFDQVMDGRTAATAMTTKPTGVGNESRLDAVAVAPGPPVWFASELVDPTAPGEFYTTLEVVVGGAEVADLMVIDDGVTVTQTAPGEYRLSGYDASLLGERGSALFAIEFATAGEATITATRSGMVGLDQPPEATPNLGGVTPQAFELAGVSAVLTSDIDGDGLASPLTDGVLLIRYLDGVRGPDLVDGALGASATRTDPGEVADYLGRVIQRQVLQRSGGAIASRDTLDLDADGAAEGSVDGALLARYLAGFRSDALTTGLTSADAAAIARFIESGRSSASEVAAEQFDQAIDRLGLDVLGLEGIADADRADGSSAAAAQSAGSAVARATRSGSAAALETLLFELASYGREARFEEIYVDDELVSRSAEGSPINFGDRSRSDLIESGVAPERVTRQSVLATLGVEEPLFVRAPDAAGYEYTAVGGYEFEGVVIDPRVGGNLLLPDAFDLFLFDAAANGGAGQWRFEKLLTSEDAAQVGLTGLLTHTFDTPVERFRLFSHGLPNRELHDNQNLSAPEFSVTAGFLLSAADPGAEPAPLVEMQQLAERGLYATPDPVESDTPVFATDAAARTNTLTLRRRGADAVATVNGGAERVIAMASATEIRFVGQDNAEDTLVVDSGGGPLRAPIVFVGGFRSDALVIDGGGVLIDLAGADSLSEVEVVDLRGSGANTLRADRDAVIENDPFNHRLVVLAGADDAVLLDTGWELVGVEAVDGAELNRYESGGATLLVSPDATVEVAAPAAEATATGAAQLSLAATAPRVAPTAPINLAAPRASAEPAAPFAEAGQVPRSGALTAPSQQIAASAARAYRPDGVGFLVDIDYRLVGDASARATGLHLRMHYDSSQLTLDSVDGVLPEGFSVGDVQLEPLVGDLDNDPATDAFVNLLWIDPSGQWPAAAPSDLFAASFTATEDYGGATRINFTGSAAGGFALRSPSVGLLELPGDYNRDRSVDQTDFQLWRASYGETVAPGQGADANFNGRVDAGDYTIWRDNLGRSLGAPGDYDRDGSVDQGDYDLWRGAYGGAVAPGQGADGDFSGRIDAGDYTVWRDLLNTMDAALAESVEPIGAEADDPSPTTIPPDRVLAYLIQTAPERSSPSPGTAAEEGPVTQGSVRIRRELMLVAAESAGGDYGAQHGTTGPFDFLNSEAEGTESVDEAFADGFAQEFVWAE